MLLSEHELATQVSVTVTMTAMTTDATTEQASQTNAVLAKSVAQYRHTYTRTYTQTMCTSLQVTCFGDSPVSSAFEMARVVNVPAVKYGQPKCWHVLLPGSLVFCTRSVVPTTYMLCTTGSCRLSGSSTLSSLLVCL